MKIESKPKKHNHKTNKIIRHKKPFKYELSDGIVDVLRWYRWPSYDFIFGVPELKSKFRKDERAFFQYRDTRGKKIISGFYLDKKELDIIIEGFERIRTYWKIISPAPKR